MDKGSTKAQPARHNRRGPFCIALLVAVLTLASMSCRLTARNETTATPTPHPTDSPVATATPSLTYTPIPTPTATPTTTPTSLSPQERQTLEAIAEEVEQLRGLDTDVPLALAFMTSQELRDWLTEELADEYPPEEVRRDVLVFVALELLPPDFDLYALLLDLYTEQVAGFYDNDADTMTVVDDQTGLDALDKITFAHEYVHDLQDQLLGLDELQTFRETTDNEDAIRAVTALIEGDAQMVTVLYLLNHLDELDPSALDGIQTDVFDAAPAVLRAELIFPYMAGLAFVQTINRQGGWDAVNDAYAAPPQSTEQILHPEKYLSGETPVAVSLPPLTSTLGTDWHLVKENTLGEFMLHLYLNVYLPDRSASSASAGWGGDRFALYEQPATGETLLLIVTTWDSETEAAEFASAYGAFAEEKYGGAAAAKDTTGAWWRGENITLLGTTDRCVTVVIGPKMDIVEQVWQEETDYAREGPCAP